MSWVAPLPATYVAKQNLPARVALRLACAPVTPADLVEVLPAALLRTSSVSSMLDSRCRAHLYRGAGIGRFRGRLAVGERVYSGPPVASLRAALSPPQPIPRTANTERTRVADFMYNLGPRMANDACGASFRQFPSTEVPAMERKFPICPKSASLSFWGVDSRVPRCCVTPWVAQHRSRGGPPGWRCLPCSLVKGATAAFYLRSVAPVPAGAGSPNLRTPVRTGTRTAWCGLRDLWVSRMLELRPGVACRR